MGEELHLTLRWVADAIGGRIVTGDPQMEVRTVGIDTRTLQPGDLFVALRGPRFDAHEFVAEALGRGAVGAIVRRGFAQDRDGAAGDRALVEVDDTTRALQDLGHAVRVASGTRVVAITGSAGKTTTKEAIAEFLSVRFRVVKNKGNLNNHIGLPLSLMQLREGPDVAVMELGMNHPGEISTLVAIAEPEVRVWTNVGNAHIGYFGSPDAIADAKAEILEGAGAGHVLVSNADDPRVMARARRFGGKLVTFGTTADADVRADGVQDLGIDGMRARVRTPAGERVVSTPLVGRGNLDNVLAAIAVALEFGVSLDEIAAAIVLIDDSYNSSPAALVRALDVVAKETRITRKVAIVGEMLELGDLSIALHRESGRAAAAAGLRLLVAIGGEPARALAGAAVEAGMPASAVRYVEASAAAAPAVVAEIRAGDLVLVKGSRGTRTDIVADAIAAEFS
ncbi:MAG: UDP-N-acetylmuramoyl-tripeptide--D-alanyl-D-alanine ligase [Acidobacteria bacterium]|nr:UDP-N-acetylmuramoyl-tripeptide--D-alanyl-D-alanine ligase [Acidobacteriota bacterium]